jgi:4-hydroxy-3-methylbut-2-en-1-yl diphosphate reductase
MSTAGAGLVVFAPLRLEARAVRAGLPAATVVRTGMGPRRAAGSASAAASTYGRDVRAVAVAGVCGGLEPGMRPGDIVLASEVRGPDGAVARCPSPALLAAALRAAGLRVHVGPIASVERLASGPARSKLAASGAIAVDMESWWLASALTDLADLTGSVGQPFAVVRVVVDTAEHRLVRPGVVGAGVHALRVLRTAAAFLGPWAAAAGERRVVLAGPRSFCAGVERAIATVERALERFPAPIYVRKQIVHNVHVVRDLERRGAVFVDELDEVPAGATVVFSAHGVAPQVEEDAKARDLTVIDATCPLVTKVHAEARRFVRDGTTVLLIGHAGHEETEGTMGESPESIRLVETVADVDRVEVPDPRRVAYLMQTTLAVDEAEHIAGRLRERFPALVGPKSDDICYATSNRQDAVRAIAAESDVVLVVGSTNSSNSQRLVEVAQREGCQAHLVDDASDIDLRWLAGVRNVGLTAGASAPPALVDGVIAALSGLGAVEVIERSVVEETLQFQLPKEVT